MVVRWTPKARNQLQKAYEYIRYDSPQNAEKVREGIINHSESLVKFPERHPLDRYKVNNKGQYRIFSLYQYQISYKIMEDTILIVRMRHSGMSPMMY